MAAPIVGLKANRRKTAAPRSPVRTAATSKIGIAPGQPRKAPSIARSRHVVAPDRLGATEDAGRQAREPGERTAHEKSQRPDREPGDGRRDDRGCSPGAGKDGAEGETDHHPRDAEPARGPGRCHTR